MKGGIHKTVLFLIDDSTTNMPLLQMIIGNVTESCRIEIDIRWEIYIFTLAILKNQCAASQYRIKLVFIFVCEIIFLFLQS